MKAVHEGNVLEYIASKIKINEETGCHEWQGSLSRDGYGQFPYPICGIKGVHRLVVHKVHGYQFTSRHEQTMHSCDVRCCVNPDHLSVGTAKENMQRAWTFGGLAHRKLPPNYVKADRVRLLPRHVAVIREMLEAGFRPVDVAALWGVSASLIYKIKSGIIWNKVD